MNKLTRTAVTITVTLGLGACTASGDDVGISPGGLLRPYPQRRGVHRPLPGGVGRPGTFVSGDVKDKSGGWNN